MLKFTLIIVVCVVGYLIITNLQLDWNPPAVKLTSDNGYINLKPYEIIVTDDGEGLKNVSVYLGKKNNEILIEERKYLPGLKKDTIQLEFKRKSIKKHEIEGEVRLRIVATDNSKLRFFRGNKTTIEKDLIIDLTKPILTELSSSQYIKHGGSGFIVYRTSEDTKRSGIKLGDHFFPGYGGYFEDSQIRVCFFAYPYNLSNDQKLYLYAVDEAGNERSNFVYHTLFKAVNKQSKLNISREFIMRRMFPFVEGEMIKSKKSIKEIFLRVNRDIRGENNKQIEEITKKSTDKRFWNGKFTQLSNSKVIAKFADKRTYKVENEIIDTQYHLGYDLSVTKRYPVEASNDGIVVYANMIGLYGNSVIIDHGLGIMTLYSHLSSMLVQEGDNVEKGIL